MKVMVLGAGIYQTPLIERAKLMGYETLVVSTPGNYPGILLADHFLAIDTTDIASVVDAARTWDINAIVTSGTDVCVPTLAYVAETLGLPGVHPATAITISSKNRFRRFLRDHGLPCPRFTSGYHFEDLVSQIESWHEPCVFKPEDSSGSRGVSILKRWNPEEARHHFNYASSFSRSGMVCVESFIDGIEVGGDGFMADGRLIFSMITHKHMDGLVVRGHSLPTNISSHQEKLVHHGVEETCKALDYLNGAVNFDVMVNGSEVVILEMGARGGGNGIADLIELACGVDMYAAIIQSACNLPLSLSPRKYSSGYGTLVLGSPSSGLLRHIVSLDMLRHSVPEVRRIQLAATVGSKVEPLIHNANQLGYVVFECVHPSDYDYISANILKSLELKVESDGLS